MPSSVTFVRTDFAWAVLGGLTGLLTLPGSSTGICNISYYRAKCFCLTDLRIDGHEIPWGSGTPDKKGVVNRFFGGASHKVTVVGRWDTVAGVAPVFEWFEWFTTLPSPGLYGGLALKAWHELYAGNTDSHHFTEITKNLFSDETTVWRTPWASYDVFDNPGFTDRARAVVAGFDQETFFGVRVKGGCPATAVCRDDLRVSAVLRIDGSQSFYRSRNDDTLLRRLPPTPRGMKAWSVGAPGVPPVW